MSDSDRHEPGTDTGATSADTRPGFTSGVEAALEEIPDAAVLTDPFGCIRHWTASSERLFGYTAEEAMGESFCFLVRPDLQETMNLRLVQAIQEVGEFYEEVPCVRKDGTEVVVGASARRVRDASGRPSGLIGIHRDLTGQKDTVRRLAASVTTLEARIGSQQEALDRAEAELARGDSGKRQSEESLRVLSRAVEQSATMVLITDAEGCIEYVNPRFCEVTGYTAAETVGQNPRILKSGSMADETYKVLWETIKAGLEWRGEFLNKKKNGDPFWTIASISPVRDPEGHITHFIANQEDITERKEAARVVEQSQKQITALVEALPDGVCLLDGSLNVLTANASGRRYLKLLSDVGVGGRLVRLGATLLKDVLRPERPELPVEVVSDGPERFVFEATSRSLQAGESVVTEGTLGGGARSGGYVLVLRDCTREREYQGRLQQQDRLAAVGQMAAGIAHDFNNLLTVILGFAQMLELREDVPTSAKVDLNRIFSQGQRAAQLIRQILDFSRETKAERQHLNLVSFLKESIKLIERTLPEIIRISFKFDENEHLVNANVSQLQQIFTNLAVNARDAMPDGGRLEISLTRLAVSPDRPGPLPELSAGEWVEWRVHDTGSGIPREALARVFEPFFTTKHEGEGTGLGLAQVYGIVGQHDGIIDVESEQGAGTTFTIYLPRAAGKESAGDAERADPAKGSGQTVLVAEDDRAVRQTITTMLERLDYRVLAAENGKEALALFEEHGDEIGILLTDLVMPEVGGLELASRLRAQKASLGTIVMSGYAMTEEGEVQPTQQIDAVLKKPVSLSALAEVLQEVIGEDG